jgi:hypothetical protein
MGRKARHLETKPLWIQAAVLARQLEIRKEPTQTNVADLNTKVHTEGGHTYLCKLLNLITLDVAKCWGVAQVGALERLRGASERRIPANASFVMIPAATVTWLLSQVPQANGENTDELTVAVTGHGFGLMATAPAIAIMLTILVVIFGIILAIEIKCWNWKDKELRLEQTVRNLESALERRDRQIEMLEEQNRIAWQRAAWEHRRGTQDSEPSRPNAPPAEEEEVRSTERRTVMTQSMCTYARTRSRPEFVYIDRGASAASGAWVE